MGIAAVTRDGKLHWPQEPPGTDVVWGSSMATLFPTQTALVQAGQGSTYTSVLNLGTTTYPRTTDALTIKSAVVPEPGSFMVLGIGVMSKAGFADNKRHSRI